MFGSKDKKTVKTDTHKGDIECRGFRKPTKDKRRIAERSAFEVSLKKLNTGYKSKASLDDYTVGRTLGTGSFGRVLLVQNKKGKRDEFFALKIISKAVVVKTNQIEHTINEKNLLYATYCPFIVKLADFYSDVKNLYFVLEFVNGGEMFTHIQKQKTRCFTAEQTRFFSAQTCLAFEYLHNLDIIFRDLKPENMLIDHLGNCKVTDFGFAKRVDDRTWTMCGTPEYLAPEIIVSKGYGHAVDWWAVGVLTFEMRCGRSPFESRSQLDMFKKIRSRDLKFPRDFDELERSFIDGLLQVDLTRRLGSMRGGVDDVLDHPYFSKVNWDAYRSGQVKSPYIPTVKGPGDASNFDTYPEEPIKWYGKGNDEHGDIFSHF